VLQPDGEHPLEAGRGLAIRIRDAVIERFDVTVGAAVVERPDPKAEVPAAPAVEAPPPAAPAGPAAATLDAAGLPPPDVTVAAGESAVVHDSRPRLRVRVRFDEICPARGTVEIVRGGRRRIRLTGEGAVTARLRPGRQIYRVRCAGQSPRSKPRAWGSLALRRDTGNAPLSRRPPRNTIDADGRRYTVLFQTRPPALALVWEAADHAAKPLALHIKSTTGERVLRAKSVHTQLRSGALREGTHTWWYAAGDGKQSPKTTLTLRFDNAAPIAQFFREGDDGTTPGAIPIDGVTVQGAKVSAAGKPVPVDDAGRFHAAVAPEAGTDAVAVRLELPRSGVHYYLRRRISRR
jgi:hypothetical protein